MIAIHEASRLGRVEEWHRIETDRQSRRAYAWIVAGFASIGAGAFILYSPVAQGWSGSRAAGLVCLMAGSLLTGVPILTRAWRSERPVPFPQIRGRTGGDVLKGAPTFTDLRPRAQRLVQAIAGLDQGEWDQIIAAAQRNGVLSRRPDAAAIDRVLHSSRPQSRAETPADRETRFSEAVGSAGGAVARTSEALDALVERGIVPFDPPYERYRVAFAMLLALLVMEHEGRAPATPLEAFVRDLSAGKIE